MNGLLVVGGGVVGGVVGGYAGLVAMMFLADMDGLGVITWVPSGAAIGAAIGVFTTAQWVA